MKSTPLVMTVVLGAWAAAVAAQGGRDEVAVIVNGEPIHMWEVGLLLPQVETELEIQGLETTGEPLMRAAVERAVDSRLLAQEARRRGFEPDEQRIRRKLEVLAENAGGRGALEAELIKSQVTYEQLRSTVVQADLVQSLVENVVEPDVKVEEADVEAYYTEHPSLFDRPDKVRARHILIRVAPDASDAERRDARARAEAARERALAGESFADLARELSESPDADEGGDLGYTERGQMVAGFDDAVWALEVGEISEVVTSDLGYHVIKVEGFVVNPPVSLLQAHDYIVELLRQQRTAAALRALTAELARKATIEVPN